MIGEPVNLAAKLEKANKAEAVAALTTAATLEIAEAQGYQPPPTLEHRAKRPIEGTGEPMDLVVLLA